MATFVMFGRYSVDAVKEISAERTKNATAVIGDSGGKLQAAYALLGETDLVLVVDFPGVNEAMQTSVKLAQLLGISFTTSPAVTVEEFDDLVGGG
jgi:uncharacterized protein with GYD domain